jgi:hypothetical protein
MWRKQHFVVGMDFFLEIHKKDEKWLQAFSSFSLCV